MDRAEIDQVALDREYSPSSLIPSIAPFLDAYAEGGRSARRELDVRVVPYGPGPEEVVHLFGASDRPVLVFVHGGFWQQLGVDDGDFAAPEAVHRGFAFASLGYGLAPRHSLDEIVTMARAGLRRIADLTPGAPLHLAGHSAGAHLVAMAVLQDGEPELRDRVRRLILLSGVYDLEPLRHSYVNDALGLDRAAAHRNSPVHRIDPSGPEVLLLRGQHETAEFARQQDLLARALMSAGRNPSVHVVPGRHHFDLPLDLARPGTVLGDLVLGDLVVGGPITPR